MARWGYDVWSVTICRIGTASRMSPLALGSVRFGEAQKLPVILDSQDSELLLEITLFSHRGDLSNWSRTKLRSRAKKVKAEEIQLQDQGLWRGHSN